MPSFVIDPDTGVAGMISMPAADQAFSQRESQPVGDSTRQSQTNDDVPDGTQPVEDDDVPEGTQPVEEIVEIGEDLPSQPTAQSRQPPPASPGQAYAESTGRYARRLFTSEESIFFP